MQLDPLPNPYYLTKKIKESFAFIDQNRNINLAQLPTKWINFWRVKDAELIECKQLLPPDEMKPSHYSVTVSHIIFSYIYTKYYRDDDFADPYNYSRMYVSFQKLLLLAYLLPKRTYFQRLSAVKLFDLSKLDTHIDMLTYIEE